MSIPVTIVAGYLGAGKTTLVNHLLREANGLRIAVLVNDFGDLPIDAELIEGQSGNVLTLAGGCICCSYGSDLMATLVSLHEREDAPQHVLIEASGVALPASIASAVGLVPSLSLSAIVVVADAGRIQDRASAAYVADTVLAQLEVADLIVLNKCDEVDATRRRSVCEWLEQVAPNARLLITEHAKVPFETLIDRSAPDDLSKLGAPQQTSSTTHGHADHAQRYVSYTLEWRERPQLDVIRRVLSNHDLPLLRVKGVVQCADAGWQEIQMVGSRLRISARERSLRSPGENGALVMIAMRDSLDPDVLHQFALRLNADSR